MILGGEDGIFLQEDGKKTRNTIKTMIARWILLILGGVEQSLKIQNAEVGHKS
jgi:hypothetical protein